MTLASVVWSALRVGSNTDTFLGGGGEAGGEAGRPLLERVEAGEQDGTSAGLDGDADPPAQQPAMSAGNKSCLHAPLPALAAFHSIHQVCHVFL